MKLMQAFIMVWYPHGYKAISISDRYYKAIIGSSNSGYFVQVKNNNVSKIESNLLGTLGVKFFHIEIFRNSYTIICNNLINLRINFKDSIVVPIIGNIKE